MKGYKAIAEFYDVEHAEMGMLQRDVPFFLHQLPRKRQSILEVACGSGRAAIPLAQAGHRVVGFDYDPAMLAIARGKRDSVGLREAALKLVRADALRLKLNKRFDWAVIFFNTFLNFTTLVQQDAVLQGIKAHLKPRGHLWLDIFNPDLLIVVDDRFDGRHNKLFFHPTTGRTVLCRTTISRNHVSQVQSMRDTYEWYDSFGVRKTATNEFHLTWIMPRELQILLERNGFEIEKTWGDYNGSKLGNRSPRIIVRARRV